MEDLKDATLRKIQKLFSLAGNNPNELEVQAAMLKAQEMLLKHGLSIEQVNGFHDENEQDFFMKEETLDQGGKRLFKWQMKIANIVAKNFRCRWFRWSTYNWGGTTIKYFGQAKDVDVAVETTNFIFIVAPKLWKSFYSKWQETPGNYTFDKSQTYQLKNDYFLGFAKGLSDKFDEQVQTKELIIVIPKAVLDAYSARSKELGLISFKFSLPNSGNAAAREQGYNDGKGATEKHKYLN